MATSETPLRDAAVIMHESYSEFVKAGFTEDQAIQLVIGMARANG